jgi:hypothetical protein
LNHPRASRRPAHRPTTLVIGGDDRNAPALLRLGVQYVPACRGSGTRLVARAIDRLGDGQIQHVIVLCRWISHPDFWALRAACRRHGVQLTLIQGGMGALRRALNLPRRGSAAPSPAPDPGER